MLSPAEATINDHLGDAYWRTGRNLEAQYQWRRALTLNPNLAMAWNLSGVAYAYLGDLDESEKRINRYKKLAADMGLAED